MGVQVVRYLKNYFFRLSSKFEVHYILVPDLPICPTRNESPSPKLYLEWRKDFYFAFVYDLTPMIKDTVLHLIFKFRESFFFQLIFVQNNFSFEIFWLLIHSGFFPSN